MHMADALLSPAVGTAFWAGSLAAIAYSARKLKETVDDRLIPLMGVVAAFIFAAQMVNFTIPGTGSSGHLGGGMILAILLGPFGAFISISSILIIQSLFFADGGILALGSNIWNLGIYPCFIAYPFIYRPLVNKNRKSTRRILVASIFSVVIGLQLGALSVVLQTTLSGKIDLSFKAFSAVMLPIHLAIGLIEGFITAAVINYVRMIRPEILAGTVTEKSVGPGFSAKGLLVGFMIAALFTGGFLSWFASSNPDGLEWSLEKIYEGTPLPGHAKGIVPEMKKLQEKTTVFPGYTFRKDAKSEEEEKPGESFVSPDPGASLSGILGTIMVILFIFIFGLGLKAARKGRL